ncbi:hypothetical protein [Streptomyces europaeiscabiei]|uniref:hypothetical protein n=1 Tax=Streptomyces europaeiscabiei TaxID=146819 RepID=UPI0013C4E518|nr:hypothetical protein [Streptomyces europaeiscabiei]
MKKNIHRSLVKAAPVKAALVKAAPVKAAPVKAVPVMTGVDARPCPRCPLSSNP